MMIKMLINKKSIYVFSKGNIKLISVSGICIINFKIEKFLLTEIVKQAKYSIFCQTSLHIILIKISVKIAKIIFTIVSDKCKAQTKIQFVRVLTLIISCKTTQDYLQWHLPYSRNNFALHWTLHLELNRIHSFHLNQN